MDEAYPMIRQRSAGPPIGFFGAVMGIASLGLGWRIAAITLHVPAAAGEAIIALAAAVFAVLAVRYVRKCVVAPAAVRAEMADPVGASYFGTVTISLALFAAALVPYTRSVATVVWAVAAAGSLALLTAALRSWILAPRLPAQLTPALFIPIVGNAVCVYAAVPLGFGELALPLFSIALVLWATVQAAVFSRLFFSERVTAPMAPMLAVLVSSPAVLASAWFTLGGGSADPLFRGLAFTALFLAVLVATVTQVTPRAPYSPAWWGYTFPAAALAGAFLRYAAALESPLGIALAWLTLGAASATVAFVGFRTLTAKR